MSRINAVRFINLNYNNNANKISDEIFHMNGESTLLSLANGGGKSVLVQMMIAPFVHKRYRDAKDRPFESYFTTGRPTFILVEWMLDRGAGYALTGMMVRRSQGMEEEQVDNLDMVNFISEYSEPCLTDIHHLPVVEKKKKELVLKNFMSCRQLFEGFKKDSSLHFFYYDMNNSAQSRQYFDKLMEYQINYKEWESIIKKINLEESGLSKLFSDCRDERGLMEKWFLESVEGKLNKEKNRIQEFQTIIGKYVGQYKDNQESIRRRDTILLFKEEGLRIEEKALRYREAEESRRRQESRIACFIRELDSAKQTAEEKLQGTRDSLADIRLAAERLEYERISREYYQLKEEQKFHIIDKEMFVMEQRDLEKGKEESEKGLHLILCAKQQSAVELERSELEEVRQKLEIYHGKNEDLTPERSYLGYGLRCHYEQAIEENESRQSEADREAAQTEKAISDRKEIIEQLEQSMRDNAAREGELKSRKETYDIQEERFNRRYSAELTRNIMGSYEPGTLEIMGETYKKEMENAVRQQGRRKRDAEDCRGRIRALERSLEEKKEELQDTEWHLKKEEQTRQSYEQELAVRISVLKYLELGEADRFDTEKILQASDRKLRELAGLRRNLEKEQDELEREYRKLLQGRTLELGKELEQELTDLGIHVVYGMEWLKKNGFSESDNREIIRRHPFLPYALICSDKEIERLSESRGDIYTSFPIPIVRRSELEKKQDVHEGGLLDLPGVSFYMLFNDNLLNEQKLSEMVAQLQQQIQRKKEAICVRETEYREYFERREMIRNQEVTEELYDKNGEQIEKLKTQSEKLAGDISDISDELADTRSAAEKLEKDILKAEGEIENGKRRAEDFEQLCSAYETYEKNCDELEKCRAEKEKLSERKLLSVGQLDDLQEKLKKTELKKDALLQEERKLQECFLLYDDYRQAPVFAEAARLDAMGIAEREARFQAITAGLSQELKELEGREQKMLRRFQDAERELEYLQRKYDLAAGEWLGTEYTLKEERYLETKLEELREKIEKKKTLANNEEIQIQRLGDKMQDKLERIQKECGQEEVLPKDSIGQKDFDAEKNRLLFQQKELQREADSIGESLQGYDENLTALAEYRSFAVQGEEEWEEDISEWSREKLREWKGSLVRDYRQFTEDCRDMQDGLKHLLYEIMRKKEFEEEYYQKPLQAMSELTEDASQVLQQLYTVLQSHEDLMKKLAVDLSFVEREKDNIVDLLEQYIKEVHLHLGKIDANSTITVRERALKMLRIQLPEWEENEELYHIRLGDMVDEIVRKGVEIFEQNENAQEYFGTQITTKNLYDSVVGIGNVQIRLYKIEAQREYPITWAEVAKNSGGEGFLSAFVILSSLLYYMRKDDTDLFSDWNEGKVLVMDNPFAQTNASHLLKPIMDMAKKANTQLICLTGLGGESIYNRFDNIYVINLIAASLRKGMQYLKVEHVKGSEPDTMVVSQVEVVEQMELEF